jgi:hypothetical protein
MVQCQIQSASRYAFPANATSVMDRKMTLDYACHENATYGAKLRATGTGKVRQDASARDFFFCENHSQLVSQVDSELKEDGWSSALVERPRALA